MLSEELRATAEEAQGEVGYSAATAVVPAAEIEAAASVVEAAQAVIEVAVVAVVAVAESKELPGAGSVARGCRADAVAGVGSAAVTVERIQQISVCRAQRT